MLCDNGEKKREFNIYAKYVKTGDVIMAHDYAYDREAYDKIQHGWGHEVWYADVKETAEKYRLGFCLQNEFDKVAWLCMKKK